MNISEPVTLLTDYLLAGCGTVWGVRLWRHRGTPPQSAVSCWAAGFAVMSVAAVTGGTTHGFTAVLGELGANVLWKLTVYSVGLAGALLLAGAVISVCSSPLRQWLLAAVVVKFLIYAVWMSGHNEFHFVAIDYSSGFVGILALQVIALAVRREQSAPWIIAGVLVTFLAAGVQASGFTLHRHFNHNDLYHVIQLGGLYLLFRGGRLLQDRSPVDATIHCPGESPTVS